MERISILQRHLEHSSWDCSLDSAPLSQQRPLKIVLTGAAGQIAYAILPLIAGGVMLGKQQKIILHLLDIPVMNKALEGVVMELQDGAYPLLSDIVATTDPRIAFNEVDIALLIGAQPRKEGMERKDLLLNNAKIFKEQGFYLDHYASKNVKVLVVGNPANTNCYIMSKNSPSIPKENFSALTRLDHNRATMQIALRTKVSVHQIHNVIIWGNHSSTQYPDIHHGYIQDYPSLNMNIPINSMINDPDWIEKQFIPNVQQRGAAVIAARKLSSAASAAKAICDHIHDWLLGTPQGEIVSMAVSSDGSYNIPENLIFSFPVVCYRGGHYSIVQNLCLDEFSKQALRRTTEELIVERDIAASL